MWVARGANVVILLIALLIVPALSSIQTAWQISLLLGSGIGVTLILRWIWWRINAWGELASIVVSMLLAPLLLSLSSQTNEPTRLLVMAVGATTVSILVSLLHQTRESITLTGILSKGSPTRVLGTYRKDM